MRKPERQKSPPRRTPFTWGGQRFRYDGRGFYSSSDHLWQVENLHGGGYQVRYAGESFNPINNIRSRQGALHASHREFVRRARIRLALLECMRDRWGRPITP